METVKKKCIIESVYTDKKNEVGDIVERPSDKALAIINPLTIDDPQESNTILLYVLSPTDKIENGDWYMDTFANTIMIANVNTDHNHYIDSCHKIISSTNKKLNIPSPSKHFIKKYVQFDGRIENILVEYDYDVDVSENHKLKVSNNEIVIRPVKDSYTASEVDKLLSNIVQDVKLDTFINLDIWKRDNM